jgi:hypothetical protein
MPNRNERVEPITISHLGDRDLSFHPMPRLFAVVIAFLALSGCFFLHKSSAPPVSAEPMPEAVAKPAYQTIYRPPDPYPETPTPSPGPGNVWIGGFYKLDGGRTFTWVAGHWAKPKPGTHEWVPGEWAKRDSDGLWIFTLGRWR